MSFHVELFDRNYGVAPDTNLTLIPQRYSATAVGGFTDAQIDVQGDTTTLWEALRWLRYYVYIKNENETIVWAGFITRAEINLGGVTVGKSLDDMANHIAVTYSYNDATGTSQRATTSYSDDTESIYRYGTKELLQSEGDLDATQADSRRDKALDIIGKPITTVAVNPGANNVGGSLYCKGLWSTLGWQLYNNAGGKVAFDVSGNYDHLLGWGKTSTGIGFEASKDGIHDIDGGLSALRADDKIVVSGASSGGNNGTFTITQATSNDATLYNGPHVYFEVTDDIKDGDSGLGFVQSTQLLAVSGSSVSGNNRFYFSKDDLASDHITVNPATITTSGIGPTITIAQGHSVLVSSGLTTEYPAASVTIKALGTIVAQSFTLPVNSPFTVAEVYLRLKKVGSPSDNLQVFIEADSAGSPSNVSLESVTVAGSTLTTDTNWVKFTFTNTLSLSYGSTYWLVIWRTGSNSVTDYYVLDMAEDNASSSLATYSSGQCKIWTGSAWTTRTNNTDVPFQIWAHQATSTQINTILTNEGQFFKAIDIQSASGIDSRQFRDADQTALVEIENLMRAGVVSGKRYLSTVTPDRIVHIFSEPTTTADTKPLLNYDGALLDYTAQPWEMGRLPAGRWIELAGVPANVDALNGVTPFFCERAEFDVSQQKFSVIEPKGVPNPWDVTNLT